ncbi:DMT family transporter [Apilactobacillus apisilvae]|uniref:DMT family transporter n=1 Tax=Apilactobacillus apisilvae TaxID=2923364 RepID=A0ABY4PGQ6_9LACO|nr:DMT family transporter [Apilactobacillus apisilvae]UQS84750.1 DMT family transporter [Apilactobacillus apisilvae]
MLYILGIIAGLVLPIQTSVNTNLKNHVGGSPYLASMLSFSVGTIVLLIATILSGQSLFFSPQLFLNQPIWIWFGGLLGVIGLTTNIIIFPYLGAVQTVIMPITGQILMGMLIDSFGLFSAPFHAFTLLRLIGIVVLIAGILMVVLQKNDSSGNSERSKLPWQILGIIAGMFQASQAPINGHLGVVLHSSIHASFISFLIGVIILIIIAGITGKGYPGITKGFGKGNPWWIWLGGALGTIYVLTNAALSPVIGAGTTVVLTLLGNLVGSVQVDKFGLLGSPKKAVGIRQYTGLVIMIIGVAVIKLF